MALRPEGTPAGIKRDQLLRSACQCDVGPRINESLRSPG
jgi:hypothetical protein